VRHVVGVIAPIEGYCYLRPTQPCRHKYGLDNVHLLLVDPVLTS